ncbi:MAG: PepSY domain-containing protein [Actinobacteria bacterium]|nr:PepSY domain-containing protein [Actinomycetota bacterium]
MDRKGIEIGEEVAREAGVPDDLDANAAPPYTVPSTRRRRAVALALGVGAASVGAGVLLGLPPSMLVMAGAMALGAVWAWSAAWPIEVSVEEALAAANREAAFPVGHASAAVGFDGWRARPVWNVLVFSADDPPSQRGLVRVDAATGAVIGSYVEGNPEVVAGEG